MSLNVGFRDSSLEDRFARDGFVIIPKLLPDEDTARLMTSYEKVVANTATNFTIDSADLEYRRRMNTMLHSIVAPRAQYHLPNYRVLGCNYVAKLPHVGYLKIHQDNAICDESKHVAIYCWCALHDMTEENGCLTVIPGSHQWSKQLRAFGDQIETSPNPFRNVYQVLRDRYERPAPISRGDAILYHSRTIHGSLPNNTDQPRIACLSACLPKEAQMIFHHRHSDTEVEAFAGDDDFYWKESFVFRRPENTPSLGMVDMGEEPLLSEEDLIALAEKTPALLHR